jgi:hypothetical protein
MYESHDNSESFVHEVLFDFEQDLPEPLDHWSLRDFGDIVSPGRYVS